MKNTIVYIWLKKSYNNKIAEEKMQSNYFMLKDVGNAKILAFKHPEFMPMPLDAEKVTSAFELAFLKKFEATYRDSQQNGKEEDSVAKHDQLTDRDKQWILQLSGREVYEMSTKFLKARKISGLKCAQINDFWLKNHNSRQTINNVIEVFS